MIGTGVPDPEELTIGVSNVRDFKPLLWLCKYIHMTNTAFSTCQNPSVFLQYGL